MCLPKLDAILYGGAFDPPHIGHLEIAQALKTQFPDSQLHVIPASTPPKSSNEIKSPEADFSARLTMLELLFANFEGDNFKINTIERDLTPPNYTIYTLRYFFQNNPNLSIGLAVGMDQFQKLDQWFETATILNMCHILVMGRGGEELREFQGTALKLSEKFTLSLKKIKDGIFEQQTGSKCQMYLMPQHIQAFESSHLRQILHQKPSNCPSGLDQKVWAFIKEKKLYGN